MPLVCFYHVCFYHIINETNVNICSVIPFFFFCLVLWSKLLLFQWISDVEKKAMYSYVYSMCDFVFPCESSMQIRIKFKQETATVKCKESMVLMKQSWT